MNPRSKIDRYILLRCILWILGLEKQLFPDMSMSGPCSCVSTSSGIAFHNDEVWDSNTVEWPCKRKMTWYTYPSKYSRPADRPTDEAELVA